MNSFSSPEWLILFPLILGVFWLFKGRFLYRPLRLCIVLLCVLCLAQPRFNMVEEGLDLWVLVDRSESAEPYLAHY